MPNPYDNEELYQFVLGGVPWVGLVTLSGHDRDQDWDVKKAKGQTGASSSHNGEPVGDFEVTFLIANDPLSDIDEFAEWEKYQALIESTTAGAVPFALPVYHADLARNRYTAVSNGGIGGMVHDGKGGASVKVKFIEHRPPQKKAVSKATSKGTANNPAKVDPNIAAKFKLELLRAQAQVPT